MQVYYEVNSTMDNVNFVSQVAYMCKSEVKLQSDSNQPTKKYIMN